MASFTDVHAPFGQGWDATSRCRCGWSSARIDSGRLFVQHIYDAALGTLSQDQLEQGQVKVGQLWADNDKREIAKSSRQRLRVVAIDRKSAKPKLSLNNEDTGKATWVKLSRMRPNSTGYRLLEDV